MEEVDYTIRPVWIYTPRIDVAQAAEDGQARPLGRALADVAEPTLDVVPALLAIAFLAHQVSTGRPLHRATAQVK